MKVIRSGLLVGMLSLSILGCYVTNPTLREKALQAKQTGDLPRAVTLYNKALSQNPADWRALERLAEIDFEQKNWMNAQHGYEYVLSLRPDHARVSHWLDQIAECLFQQGRRSALRQMLRQANAQYGKSVDFLRQANYLTKLSDMDQAKIAYQKAIHFAPKDDAEPYIAMAAFYELLGDKGNAIKNLRLAYFIAPENISIADRLRHYGIVPGPTAGIKPIAPVPPLPEAQDMSAQTQPEKPSDSLPPAHQN